MSARGRPTLMLCAALGVALAGDALADDASDNNLYVFHGPYSLVTTPAVVHAGQAFQATLGAYANPLAIGVHSELPAEVHGTTVIVNYASGCGFPCPGPVGLEKRLLTFPVPALKAGVYTVFVIAERNTVLADFAIAVDAPSALADSTPTLGAPAKILTVLAVAALALQRLRARRRTVRIPFETHSGNNHG